jgi:hypothetical protein
VPSPPIPCYLVLLKLPELIVWETKFHTHLKQQAQLFSKGSIRVRGCWVATFRNVLSFYGELLLAPRPTPMMEGHPHLGYFLRGCLFSTFTATLQNRKPYLPSATGWRAILGTRDAPVTEKWDISTR